MGKTITELLGEQKSIGKWYGNIKIVGQQASGYVQFLTLVMASISSYPIAKVWFADHIRFNLSVWQYLAGELLLIALPLVLLEWRFSVGSTFESWNYLWWKHKNPMREEMEGMREEQAKTRAELAAVGAELAKARAELATVAAELATIGEEIRKQKNEHEMREKREAIDRSARSAR